jgi:hypothetical protein
LSQTIVPVTAPVDVIIVVDNSGSMSQEILALEENINLHFAEVMSAANIDYRIIVVSKHGSGGLDVCVKPPLSSTSNCSEEPVNVPEQFYQYSVPVASHNALCILLDSFYGDYPDQFNLAPSGWSLWVRPEAHKVFIVLGDDGAACTWNGTYFSDLNNETGGQTVASDFDQALLALSPLHFGTPSDRNYSWYSIIGMEPKDPAMPLQPWLPTDPVTTNLCTPASVDPGTAYQWLSKGTDALRWPLCHVSGYDVILQGIVEDIPKQASAPCRFAVPAPSLGQTIDVDSVLLEWTPSASPPSTFSQVTDLASCAPDAFYIEGNNIELCPATCADTTADPSATLDIHYFCN